MHQWETQNETVGVLMSVLFSTGVQMFESERVYVPVCAFSKCLCNSPTNILLPARSRKCDTTEQNKRLWCNTRPNIARAPWISEYPFQALLQNVMHNMGFFFNFFLPNCRSLFRGESTCYSCHLLMWQQKQNINYDILSRMNKSKLVSQQHLDFTTKDQ